MANKAETSKKILVINGESDLRENCRQTLVRFGYEVDVATTGQEGLAKIQTADFAVALIDVTLPDISGIDLLGLIRKLNPDTICIVVTDCPAVEVAVQAMKLGAYDFIARPFSDDRLLLAIVKGIERRRLQQEARRARRLEEEALRRSHEKAILEELDRVESTSMRKVAHELRAPVAAIRSFLTLILQGYVSPEKARQMQERAAERADELLVLIDDVLNLAHLKDARYPSTREMVCVEAVLHNVLALHAHEAEEKGLKLKVETRPCPPIDADPTHILQLWTNLISNAIKYTPKGGRVTVQLIPEGEFIVGRVKDTGIGIAKEDLPRLFKEFFRTDQAKAFAPRGTGLGLSIVKQIVQQYGGDIAVESELGRGTQFTFRLPVSSV